MEPISGIRDFPKSVRLYSTLGSGSGKRYDIQHPYQQSKLVEFIKLVNMYYKSHHNLDFYADRMGMSIASLGKACKEAAGITAKDVIIAKLIAEIKMTLVFDPRPINDISYELGFPEYSSFNSFIRQHLKTTATELKANSRLKSQSSDF